jgi:hypothetical protein
MKQKTITGRNKNVAPKKGVSALFGRKILQEKSKPEVWAGGAAGRTGQTSHKPANRAESTHCRDSYHATP